MVAHATPALMLTGCKTLAGRKILPDRRTPRDKMASRGLDPRL
jgi:hypothetical protein